MKQYGCSKGGYGGNWGDRGDAEDRGKWRDIRSLDSGLFLVFLFSP